MAKKSKNKSQKTNKKKNYKPLGLPSRGRRKLNDTQVLDIVARLSAGGVKQKDIAVEYGVSSANISAIWCGRSYVWLTRIGLAVDIALKEAA